VTQITKVSYAKLTNLGNYENEKIELEAVVKEGEDWKIVLEELRTQVSEQTKGTVDLRKIREEFYEKEQQLNDLTLKVERAQKIWETVSTFMKAQGINTNPSQFPQLVEAEIIGGSSDEDEDDDEIPL
jgi:hypothetical protein